MTLHDEPELEIKARDAHGGDTEAATIAAHDAAALALRDSGWVAMIMAQKGLSQRAKEQRKQQRREQV